MEFSLKFFFPLDDPKKVDHLLAQDGAKERLHLVKANLLEEGSFDAAVNGCEGVFHTASPFYHGVTDPQVSNHITCIIYARARVCFICISSNPNVT